MDRLGLLLPRLTVWIGGISGTDKSLKLDVNGDKKLTCLCPIMKSRDYDEHGRPMPLVFAVQYHMGTSSPACSQ
jgi:hypothetical protein